MVTVSNNLDLKDFEDDAECYDTNLSNTSELLADEKMNTSDETYILHISATIDANFNTVIGLSNNTCEVYHFDGAGLLKQDTLVGHEDAIIGCQFSSENNNLLYSGSKDGVIKLWDLRLPKKLVSEFRDTTSRGVNDVKPMSCFDLSHNNRLLAAGTEVYESEAFILFWDIRNVKLLGGYWESHTDDVTQVRFNPNDANKLISGSTDGLINVYDLKQSTEDDSLIDTLNTESTIENLVWYRYNNKDCICCITHTVDVQLWKTDDVEAYALFTRADIAKAINKKSEAHSCLVTAHKQLDEELLILSSTKFKNKLQCLKTKEKSLVPESVLKENKQIVRSSWFNQFQKVLITGGESGILNVWKLK